ncbi:hypothetical protein RIF29_31581 [Crotalaria pallida]|uniref:Uncharacterized protein n=1 Tax=Crotalaria pallida TaxID=3830 RepID=A0AAN9EJK3_CROPI
MPIACCKRFTEVSGIVFIRIFKIEEILRQLAHPLDLLVSTFQRFLLYIFTKTATVTCIVDTMPRVSLNFADRASMVLKPQDYLLPGNPTIQLNNFDPRNSSTSLPILCSDHIAEMDYSYTMRRVKSAATSALTNSGMGTVRQLAHPLDLLVSTFQRFLLYIFTKTATVTCNVDNMPRVSLNFADRASMVLKPQNYLLPGNPTCPDAVFYSYLSTADTQLLSNMHEYTF